MWGTISRGNPDRVVFHPGPVFRLDSGDTGAFVGGKMSYIQRTYPTGWCFTLPLCSALTLKIRGPSLGASIVYCI